MEKVKMKNWSNIKMLLSYPTECSKVLTNNFMLGTADKLLRGLKSLNVLKADTFEIPGIF